MERHHWLLGALAAAVVSGGGAYALARDDGGPPQVEAGSTTTEGSTSSAASSVPSSTTATSAAPSTSTTETATTLLPAPPFESSVEPVTAAQLGSSWRPDMGCTEPGELRAVNVSYWGYDGQVHAGRLVVAAGHADRIVAVFRDIYEARFPIERMVPIDAYGGDDQASMRANNTSGFNCRYVAGTTKLSQHAFGRAVDVNPLVNPYVKGSTVDPPEGAPYADRSRNDTGMIRGGDAVVDAFEAQGWSWGGYWSSGQDYQHFSASGG